MPLEGFNIDACTASALPGTGVLEYVPIDEVDATSFERAISSAYNHQKALSLDTGWLQLPYAANTGAWQEEQQDDDQGETFRINVSCLLPADSAAVRGELNAMRRHRFLVRLTRGSLILLAGSPEQPMKFESKFDSGADGADTRGHRITFSGVSLWKSPGYVPVF
jgi:hypothetical protein